MVESKKREREKKGDRRRGYGNSKSMNGIQDIMRKCLCKSANTR